MHVEVKTKEGSYQRGMSSEFSLPPVTVLPHVANWFGELGCRFGFKEVKGFCEFKRDFMDVIIEPFEVQLLQEMTSAYSRAHAKLQDNAWNNMPPYDNRTPEQKSAKLTEAFAKAKSND